jgi:hypothetical protein
LLRELVLASFDLRFALNASSSARAQDELQPDNAHSEGDARTVGLLFRSVFVRSPGTAVAASESLDSLEAVFKAA